MNASNMHTSFNITAFRFTATKDSFKRKVMFSNFFFKIMSQLSQKVCRIFPPSCCLLSLLLIFFWQQSLLTMLSSFLVLFTVSWTVLCTNTVTCYFFVSWKCVKCSTCRLLIISLISIYLRLIISSLFYYPHKRSNYKKHCIVHAYNYWTNEWSSSMVVCI